MLNCVKHTEIFNIVTIDDFSLVTTLISENIKSKYGIIEEEEVKKHYTFVHLLFYNKNPTLIGNFSHVLPIIK